MTRKPIDELLGELDRTLADERRSAQVTAALERYAASGADDWRAFAHFEADYYARNLVRQSDLFELIVLCWGAGQRSPIHDHQGQRCWMAVLDGEVSETLYKVRANGEGPLESAPAPGAARNFRSGSVAFIVDEMGWHRIQPVGGRPAVTMHLYSRPIRTCSIYDEERDAVVTRKLRYHSIGGVVQTAHQT
jgi:cysteine dioxygenase